MSETADECKFSEQFDQSAPPTDSKYNNNEDSPELAVLTQDNLLKL